MSWVVDSSLTYCQKFCINVLKCGPIPRHVAFIMDGNRRFATKKHVEKAEGHTKGFDKLAECLQWCMEFGIKEATVYAFSIENFKRSKEEVDTLMRLAREKFKVLFEEKEKLMEEGVCIRVIGNMDLLPDDIKENIAKTMLLTKNNKTVFLNVAFAYTSRDEISNSVKTVVQGVKDNKITINDINKELLKKCLYTNLSPDPDILIRTSGEVRLSDFLLWQSTNTQIYFADVLWPEFTVWHLMACIFKYQRSYYNIEKFKEYNNNVRCKNSYISEFVEGVHRERLELLENYVK
ncbi:unnamed protein product [Brassicogethes aeneus]|uniref:Alkyl transferase n=1 Tax=Brassicogethes aeneus TaxID=1431903 RepID=A0A9P0BI02_BRAAE|nr:unnamed protein product [Brassicogethes aeneus]